MFSSTTICLLIINALCLIIGMILRKTFFYKNLSERDNATGCYNKDWAIQRKNSKLVKMMKRTGHTYKDFGILFIDMDEFKKVNDLQGHIVGDSVIKQTVSAINECLKKEDVLIRFGGDEFMVIKDCVTENGLSLLAEQIRCKVALSTQHTVSIGGTVFNSSMEVNVEELINIADENVYCAKADGKNCVFIDSERL